MLNEEFNLRIDAAASVLVRASARAIMAPFHHRRAVIRFKRAAVGTNFDCLSYAEAKVESFWFILDL